MVYLPPAFTEARPEVLIEHIARHDFGLLISHGPDGLIASHIPFRSPSSKPCRCHFYGWSKARIFFPIP